MPYDNLRKFMKNPQPDSYAPEGMDDFMLRTFGNPPAIYDGFEVVDNATGKVLEKFKTEEAAAKWMEEQANVHSVKLTPEMIQAIKAGLPLFALGGVAIAPEAQDKYFNLKKLMGK